jgi:hypothetical protein
MLQHRGLGVRMHRVRPYTPPVQAATGVGVFVLDRGRPCEK